MKQAGKDIYRHILRVFIILSKKKKSRLIINVFIVRKVLK